MSTIVIVPGATAEYDFYIKKADGTPQSLDTLAQAWFTAKRNVSDTDASAVVQATMLGGMLSVVGDAVGVLRMVLPPAMTLKFADTFQTVWDVRLKFGDGVISNPQGLSGEVLVEVTATQST